MTTTMITRLFTARQFLLAAVLLAAACGGLAAAPALAAPDPTPWPVDGDDETVAVAAAAFSGWYATADAFEDRIEIRGVNQSLLRAITRADLQALLPWMSLGGGPDGPSALAFTASGRVLYILVHDDTLASDGQGSDAVLRYDLPSNVLSIYARLDAFDRGDIAPHLAMAHHAGRLYVATATAGVRSYQAPSHFNTGSIEAIITLPSGSAARGLAIDRDSNRIFLASDTGVWWAPITSSPSLTLTQVVAGALGADIRAIAWGDHFGAPSPASQKGLYILSGGASPDTSRIHWLSLFQAYASSPQIPALYTASAINWHDLAFTADGRLFVAADEDALLIADTADTRLSYDDWLTDELQQVIVFGRGLISPDGEPAGWVIDADVPPTASRFHPATPDAAAWTIFLLLASDDVLDDPTARASVRAVLTRYAGLSTDNIRPSRTADGIYRHWIDPFTGQAKPGWDPEFATLSTMKIVAAAARAMQHFPDDPVIARAASRIIFRTRSWDAYLQAGTDALSFKGALGGGPDGASWARPFHEGIIFVEQAGAYGGAFSDTIAARWFNRALWPTATYIAGRPVTSTAFGRFEAAFISLYPALLSQPYRADSSPFGWRTQVQNVRWSHAAWTDDNQSRYYTVFSAGTTPTGYNADSISNHPSDIATFTSLMALSAFGDPAESVGAYAAYRKNARQLFKTGGNILYRRSNLASQVSYAPNSAGLPDVGLGALGLAELVEPGFIDRVLARPYPTTELCPLDLTADGAIDVDDLYRHLAAPTDLNGDLAISAPDTVCLRAWLRRNEPADTASR